MLIISIEELTLTTIFQVTSSDWVEANAWSSVVSLVGHALIDVTSGGNILIVLLMFVEPVYM